MTALFLVLAEEACTLPPPLTYSDDVAPILARSCVSCHHRAHAPGELPGYALYGTSAGVSPFPLETLDEVRLHSSQVLLFVSERAMPPWDAEDTGDCQTFREAAWLPPADLDTLTRWIALGMPERAGASTTALSPALPSFTATTSLSLGRFTLTTAYSSFPGGPVPADDYRCVQVRGVQGGLLTGYAVTPGTPLILDGLVAYLITNPASATLSTADDFDCSESLPLSGLPAESEYHPVATWVPGAPPTALSIPIPVPPGSDLLIRLHYNVKGTSLTDFDTRLELQYATSSAVPTQLVLADAPASTSGITTLGVPLSFLASTAALWAVSPDLHPGQTVALAVKRAGGGQECLLSAPAFTVPWPSWRRIYQYQAAVPLAPQDQLQYTCSGPGRCTMYGYLR